MKDEDLENLNGMHNLILPHSKESEETTSKLDKSVKKWRACSALREPEASRSISGGLVCTTEHGRTRVPTGRASM